MAMHNPCLLSMRAMRPVTFGKQCFRHLHKRASSAAIPSPTPFVPDVQTFLTLIGRGMNKHASKLPSWDKLFSIGSPELKELGIEPSSQRRYLLRKREKFRRGIYGPGGDLQHVVNGTAQLRVVEVPKEPKDAKDATVANKSAHHSIYPASLSSGMRKIIVNLPPDAKEYIYNPSNPPKKIAHMKVHHGNTIKGPFLQPIKGSKGSAALFELKEGMWEDRLGVKVDGGERRRAEVRAKRRSEERRKGII
ncbi:mitochondrial 37S ribosomal protein mS41 [Aspergillus homomorphus CBS 101889]|uniref:Small ribosomal subunit protein mS41 n=1 Tax=Aspergillus homomorphus (strain CBS 101889) TaxID=1450537 RepID=A0A395I6Z9_ASPHC|nr:hypothetical protein BO97DRAFT_363535 [Aspergillus homomorphus CBS 101889]RAL15685.1 hypothetical protein BO97DRAFT_363535 [Aspergillus homomorphus CBS 101889]